MPTKEMEKQFLDLMSDYLLSLPFDLKILQEAVTDTDLDRGVREIAAGTIIHTLLPQEGEIPSRYLDDVLFVRAALRRVANDSEGGTAFAARFSDVYDKLGDHEKLCSEILGETWPWLTGKISAFSKAVLKGKKAVQCLDDEEAASFLYEEGLEFQTNYNVDEDVVRNKIRRVDAIVEFLHKRRAEESKKIS